MNRPLIDTFAVAQTKGREYFILLFDADRQSDVLRVLGKWASNPELSFSWYDAAVCSAKVRSLCKEAT